MDNTPVPRRATRTRVSLPAQIVKLIDPTGTQTSARVAETLVLELFQEGRISSGKVAELLGISKDAFRGLLTERSIPYFRQTYEEVLEDAQEAASARSDPRR